MKKLVSFIGILVLLVILSLSYTTAQAENKFKITATVTTNSVKLKWSKAKGAKHYKIYRKTGKNKFKFVKKVTKRTFDDKKLKENKKYTYKVKAFKKNKKGKFYSFKSATKTVKTKTNKQPQTTMVVSIEIPTTTTVSETVTPQTTTKQTEATTIVATETTTLAPETTTSTTQPTVSTTQTTSTTTTTTTQTQTSTTGSTTQPTIPLQPITTDAKGYEELVKEARLRVLHQDPRTAHATLDDIRIPYYFGTFNGCIVVMINDSFTTENCAVYDFYIDDVRFWYGGSNHAVVLKDGVFYTVEQAYNNGLISHDDLVNIGRQTIPHWLTTTITTTQPTTTKPASLTLGSLPPVFEHDGSLKSYYDSLDANQLVSLVYKDFDYIIPNDSQLMNIEYSLYLADDEWDNLKETWGYTAKFKLTKEGYGYLSKYFIEKDQTAYDYSGNVGVDNYSWWYKDDSIVTCSNRTIGKGHLVFLDNQCWIKTIWNCSWLTCDDNEYYLYLDTPLSDMTCEWYELKNESMKELPELSEHQGSLKSYYESLNKYQLAKIIKKDFDYEIPSDSELMNIEYSNSDRWLADEEDNLKELWGYSAKFKLTKEGYKELAEYFASKENSWDHLHDPQKQGIDYSWWDLTSEDVIHTNATIGKGQLYCANGHLVTIFTIWNYSWLAQIDGEYYLYLDTPLSDTTCEWYELKNG